MKGRSQTSGASIVPLSQICTGGIVVVVVVIVGQVAAVCGVQTSVRTSLSFRFGLPLAMTMSVTLLFPAFFPLFFSLTVAVNAAHAESVPFGLVIVIDAPFWTLPLIFFRVAATHDPEGLFTQPMYMKVHAWFGVLTPSRSHLGLQSSHMIMPPFSSSGGTPVNCARHSSCSFAEPCRTARVRATVSTKAKPRR